MHDVMCWFWCYRNVHCRHLSHTQLDIAIVDRDIPGKHASYKAGC